MSVPLLGYTIGLFFILHCRGKRQVCQKEVRRSVSCLTVKLKTLHMMVNSDDPLVVPFGTVCPEAFGQWSSCRSLL